MNSFVEQTGVEPAIYLAISYVSVTPPPLIFLMLQYTNPFYGIQIYCKKKPKSFLLDLGSLLEFICYNFLYHPKYGCVFGSLLYVKPITTSPHNESDQILLALLATLSC